MTSALDTALLSSSRAGSDLGWKLIILILLRILFMLSVIDL